MSNNPSIVFFEVGSCINRFEVSKQTGSPGILVGGTYKLYTTLPCGHSTTEYLDELSGVITHVCCDKCNVRYSVEPVQLRANTLIFAIVR